MQQPASAEPPDKNEYIVMKRFTIMAVCLLAVIELSAQTQKFEQRYNLLVSKLGPAGVGIETVLDNWAKVDSTSASFMKARFDYYYSKAQRTEVVKKTTKKYLGMDPLLALKDSLGANVYYYQETFFDDGLFGKAVKEVERAIKICPDNLDFRFMKANAYISYEKESADMALAYLLDLAQADVDRGSPWTYNGSKAEEGFLEDAMQEYCYSFYTIGTPESMRAFLELSRKMNSLHPSNLTYINNIGSYYMVAQEDFKTALKYYKKVLKKSPDDPTALRNGMIAARKLSNAKLEAKCRLALEKSSE